MKVKWIFVAVMAALGGCRDSGPPALAAGSPRTAPAAETPASDSILVTDTMIARYQAGLPAVTSLGDDAPGSIDELIDRFLTAVADSSVSGLAAITMSEAEFAYLYFPTSMYTRPPYAQPPVVNWLLLEQNSLKGRHRLLREYGGRGVAAEGRECTGDVIVEGRNRIHEQCTIRIRNADDGLDTLRLFGSILERDGRFKLMSLANRL